MYLKLVCQKCVDANGVLLGEVMTVEIRDDNLYKVTCSKDHESLVFIPTPKYEVLFHLGALALLDGHSREAVASFAAALERFYEFYIRAIRIKRSIQVQEFNKCWKSVAKQSERQLGAFLFLYLLENNRMVKLIDDKLISFRNNVIHQGYIPSYEEVFRYGESVMAFIMSVAKELRASDNAVFGAAMLEVTPKEFVNAPEHVLKVHYFVPTVMQSPRLWANQTTLREELEALKQSRHKQR